MSFRTCTVTIEQFECMLLVICLCAGLPFSVRGGARTSSRGVGMHQHVSAPCREHDTRGRHVRRRRSPSDDVAVMMDRRVDDRAVPSWCDTGCDGEFLVCL